MTTIVVDRKEKIMAADMQLDVGGNKYKTKKITRMYDVHRSCKCLVSTAGDGATSFLFERWLEEYFRGNKNDELFPKGESNFMGIVLYEDSDVYLYLPSGQPMAVLDRYSALGSGSDLALGALYAGADIRTAIKIAGRRDSGTGMGIQVERLI